MPPREGAGPRSGDSRTEPSPKGAGPGKRPERRLGSTTRYGLALVAPRFALAVADDPGEPGRAGTDLLVLLLGLAVAVHLRALVAAGWLAAVAGAGIGARALLVVASQAFTADLAFLLIGAVIVFVAGGPRRALGRAFDLACVAVVPLCAIEAIATAVVRGLSLPAPDLLGPIVTLAGTAWSGTLLALALVQMRRAPRAFEVPPEVAPRGRRAGWALVAVLAIGAAIQGAWIATHLDWLRPMSAGDPAPEVALPTVGKGGALGPRVRLSSLRGKVVLVDLWATWCNPCMQAMPGLAELAARDKPNGLEVLAVNLDDAAKARAIFDDAGYPMTLVFDDDGTADRLGVGVIPHAVVIDRAGVVRGVFRGDPAGAERLAAALASSK